MPAHWPVASFELSAELVKRLDSLDKSVLVSLIDSEKHASAEEIHNALEVSPESRSSWSHSPSDSGSTALHQTSPQKLLFHLQESDPTLRRLGWLTNLSDLFYYPFEHLYWLLDRRVLNPSPHSSFSRIPWGDLSNLCWALALLGRVLKSLRYLDLLSETAKDWEEANGQCLG